MKAALEAQFPTLDPVMLLHDIRHAQARLVMLADAAPSAESGVDAKSDVEQFLEGLRHAWKEGEVRPTARKRPPVPRGRRRPDPLASVTTDLRKWFDEDKSQTRRDLLSRLQAAHPDGYSDGFLRTVLRRLKNWRADLARDLVFGDDKNVAQLTAADALRNVEAPRVRRRQDHRVLPASPTEISREHSAEATA